MHFERAALGILAVAATLLGGSGIAQELGIPFGIGLPASAALHAVWIASACRRNRTMLTLLCWPVCWSYADAGAAHLFRRRDTSAALVLEVAVLLLALSFSPGSSWTERLARIRRFRNAVAVQWDLFTAGPPGGAEAEQQRLMSELADAEAAAAEARPTRATTTPPRAAAQVGGGIRVGR